MSHRYLMAIIDYGRTVPPYLTLTSKPGAAASTPPIDRAHRCPHGRASQFAAEVRVPLTPVDDHSRTTAAAGYAHPQENQAGSGGE